LTSSAAAESVACRGCDLLQRIPPLPSHAKAHCPRCAERLVKSPSDPLERSLALAVAAAIAFVVANATPLMGLNAQGREASTTLIGGARQMWLQGQPVTAVVVAFCAVIAPASYIALMLTVLLSVKRAPAPRWVGLLLRWAQLVRPWSMDEVMMLGVLVALTKIAELATVVPGVGMFAVFVLIVLLAALLDTFNSREVWGRVRWADETQAPVPQVASSTGRRQ
jgi:paraquat-inducible protein A